MKAHQSSRREQARHTDDWLITYADTVTLLLCLFVVILSARGSERPLPPTPMAAAVVAPSSPPFPPRIFDPPIPEEAVVEEASPNVFVPVEPPATVTPQPAPVIADPSRAAASAVVEQQGDRITTLQIGSAAFFGSGNATLSPGGRSLLNEVAVSLRSARFAGYQVTVEGHTDDSPINTPQFQSNWELSTARAAAVVRYLLEQGVAAGRLTAAGYADTFPVAPNRTADGTVIPDNQARNRRVVIRLEKIDRPDR